MKSMVSLPKVSVYSIVNTALFEDLGCFGDRTSDVTLPVTKQIEAHIISRTSGVFCGVDFVLEVFSQISPDLSVLFNVQDGDELKQGTVIAKVSGAARQIFSGERLALNFAGHLSGIASMTAQMVAAIEGTKAKVAATRKTLPGLRLAQKYAVTCGGGSPHRYGLGDGILIKDNHIAVVGNIQDAVMSALEARTHFESLIVEVDTLSQLDQIIEFPLQGVLLDNMSLQDLAQAVNRVNGKFTVEVSGGITLDNIRDVAQTGVDIISCGWLTHTVRNLDLGLDIIF